MNLLEYPTTGPGTGTGLETNNNNNNNDDARKNQGLCLLSLDGGGVRGLSTLLILRGIMNRLNDTREEQGLGRVKPCEVFDLIGGTSTGGLIAIMLGRLEMDVEECITEYKTLMRIVFAKKEESRIPVLPNMMINPRFSSDVLAKSIKSVIEGATVGDNPVSINEPFYLKDQDKNSRRCKVFVCAQRRETGDITRLRSYHVKGLHPCEATIWEAALATSAATGFFMPVKIGDCMYGDGALGANNPAEKVEQEASKIWCESNNTSQFQSRVKCFVSLGTGDGGINPVSDKAWKFLTKSLARVATETEATAEAVARRWSNLDNEPYFRFNVQRGLQAVGLAEWKYIGLLEAATDGYLDIEDTIPRIARCVDILRTKEFGLESHIVKQATLQAVKHRKMQKAPETMSKAEMNESARSANRYLEESRMGDSHQTLKNARDIFLKILGAQRAQQPPPQARDLCYTYNKLRYTCQQLSQLNYDASDRMAMIDRAAEYGKHAVQCAVDSRNVHREAQMRFYHACVSAQRIQLKAEEQCLQVPTELERENARRALEEAWVTLQSIQDLDGRPYERMNARSLSQLLIRS